MPSSSRAPWHPTALLLVLALWLATAGNLPLWRALWKLPETHGLQSVVTLGSLVLVVLAATVLLLGLFLWPRWLKPAGIALLLITASSSYFMSSYGIVIDPSMLTNVVQTDMGEALDLVSWPLVVTLLLGAVLPGLWWWRQPVRRVGGGRLVLQQLGVGLLGLLVAVAMLWISFQDVASLMRNHKTLRYMINPFNTVYAVARVSVGRAAQAQQTLQPVGMDAHLMSPGDSADTSPLIVLVVGETARAANFGLGGYGRDTTPLLKQLQSEGDLVYFSSVSSCGTNTQTSVPCMFSPQGRETFDGGDTRQENLLDVLQRAGLAVLWLDNQSGCKGVCDRVPHADTRNLNLPDICPEGECFDEAMLRALPDELARLDPERRARGTVVVMHQMGSHGPAYYKRSPPAMKLFQPECTSHALQECPPEQIQNAYDNSLRNTDHLLAETVRWLQTLQRPTALVYVSDHGESLGEKGLYLHGMPYRMAPTEQTHVPMLTWVSKPLQQAQGLRLDCLRAQAAQPWSHDNLFHTMLGLARVGTTARDGTLDMLAPCTGPS
ncbi:MAG: phosphoethanolamine--lipid A transferase [Burkholderiaceae bacterium]|nr:phosphoethanolamine--lipid A transferase [Burkholderiaceae bacterium]